MASVSAVESHCTAVRVIFKSIRVFDSQNSLAIWITIWIWSTRFVHRQFFRTFDRFEIIKPSAVPTCRHGSTVALNVGLPNFCAKYKRCYCTEAALWRNRDLFNILFVLYYNTTSKHVLNTGYLYSNIHKISFSMCSNIEEWRLNADGLFNQCRL